MADVAVEQDNTVENEALRELKAAGDRKKVLAEVEGMYKKARSRRLVFERQWYYNMAFYFGKQWVTWHQGAGTASDFAKLIEPAKPPWRVRLVSNKIKPIIRKELAKVTKEKPTFYVVPASADDEDITAAQAGEHISEHLWRDLNMNRTIRRAAFWASLCGTSFIKDWFESTAVDSSGREGAIKSEAITPFHFLVPNPQEEELENQPWCIHVLAKEPEWVKNKYGVDAEADTGAGAGVLEQKFLNALGVEGGERNYVSVKEIWIKPNAKYKNGAVITWAGERILKIYEGWPYEHREFPFTRIPHIPTGRFYADSVIVDLIPLQKEYNRTRSQIIEAKNRMSKPQLIAPKGSVDPRKITSEPGLIIQYTPGFTPPTPLPLQSIPGYVVQELDRTISDMDDIASQHEVTKGRTPPGVEAATAIAYLQEQDDSALAPTIAELEEGIERIGRHFLSHVQQFWTAERTVRVMGPNSTWESYEFTRASLAGNTDLKVQAGSAMPRSLAAKQAFLMELGKMGWIPPDKVLKYLELSETNRLYDEMQNDYKQVQRENLKMAAGEQIQPHPWDNDLIHIQEHYTFFRKQAFENLNPEIQQFMVQHVEFHKMQLQQKAQQGQMPDGVPLPPQGDMPPQGGPGPAGNGQAPAGAGAPPPGP